MSSASGSKVTGNGGRSEVDAGEGGSNGPSSTGVSGSSSGRSGGGTGTMGSAGRANDVREAALTLFAERGYHGTSMKDIAAALKLQAPSLYNHVAGKQDILRDVMVDTMDALIKTVTSAIASTTSTSEQLRRATESHVRYHARHPREVRIGNHELPALEEPYRTTVVKLRRSYSRTFLGLIERGVNEGVFDTTSPLLSAYAILQMGIGVAMWFHPSGPLSEDDVVFQYGDIALRIVGARAPAPSGSPARKRR